MNHNMTRRAGEVSLNKTEENRTDKKGQQVKRSGCLANANYVFFAYLTSDCFSFSKWRFVRKQIERRVTYFKNCSLLLRSEQTIQQKNVGNEYFCKAQMC